MVINILIGYFRCVQCNWGWNVSGVLIFLFNFNSHNVHVLVEVDLFEWITPHLCHVFFYVYTNVLEDSCLRLNEGYRCSVQVSCLSCDESCTRQSVYSAVKHNRTRKSSIVEGEGRWKEMEVTRNKVRGWFIGAVHRQPFVPFSPTLVSVRIGVQALYRCDKAFEYIGDVILVEGRNKATCWWR